MVDTLHKLGISISYDRVLQIENSLATAVCALKRIIWYVQHICKMV